MTLTADDIFKAYEGHPDIQPGHRINADMLCQRVNQLLTTAARDGVEPDINPATGTIVSGEKNGGWRPPECPIGAPNSAHKQGLAVDIYDPDGLLDDYITDVMLMQIGLYREHPAQTRSWCHLTTRAPKSERRTFYA